MMKELQRELAAVKENLDIISVSLQSTNGTFFRLSDIIAISTMNNGDSNGPKNSNMSSNNSKIRDSNNKNNGDDNSSDDSSRTEAGDSRSPGGGKWQQRLQERCRQRYTKFGINVYSTRKPASLDTTNGNSLQRVNLCTDILLQPELYLELFSHKGTSNN